MERSGNAERDRFSSRNRRAEFAEYSFEITADYARSQIGRCVARFSEFRSLTVVVPALELPVRTLEVVLVEAAFISRSSVVANLTNVQTCGLVSGIVRRPAPGEI